MEKSYNHLKPEERAAVMLMMRDGATVRSVARTLSRAPSTISRELKKDCQDGQIYEAAATGSDQEGAEKHSTIRARNNLAVENMAVI